MENISNTKSFYASMPSKSQEKPKPSTPLKQTMLDQYGIKSPKRSLFTESNNILFGNKLPLPSNKDLTKAQTEKPDGKIDEPKYASSSSKTEDHSQSPAIKVPLVSLQRLSEALVASKMRIEKFTLKDDNDKQCLEAQDEQQSEAKNVCLEIEDLNISCDISQKQTEDFSSNDEDEDELLEVGFLKTLQSNNKTLTRNKKEKQNSESSSDYKRKPFVQPQYKYGLNSILSEREKQAETASKLQEMEKELQMEPVYHFDVMTVLDENQLNVQNFNFQAPNINFIHPGIKVFELSKCFQLYQMPPFPSLMQENFKMEDFDKLLCQVPPKDFPELLTLGSLENQVVHLCKRPWLLNYMFHLLASHPIPHVAHTCFKTLQNVVFYLIDNAENLQIKIWFPSFQDIVAVLLNLGASLSMLHPQLELLPFTEQQICDKYSVNSEQNKTETKSFPIDNLRQVLEIVASFEDIPDTYTYEELVDLIVMCFAIALDETMKTAVIEWELRTCILNAMAQMSAKFWESKVVELARLLLKLTDHHHNMVTMAQLMPYSDRGLQLQGVLAYYALHILMEVEPEKEVSLVEPKHALHFFKTYVQTRIDDYYLLQSIITLIDLCVGKEPDQSSRKTLMEFATTMKDAAGKIRDRIMCTDATEVKNYMINVASKWLFMVQDMPSTQKTMFDYVSTHYQIEQVENSDNLEETEMDVEQDILPGVDVSVCEEDTNNMH